jgi:ribosomal protein S18 acetylase RimI-like enzyme
MMNLGLRPVTASDESFLYEVYCSTRQDELALVEWRDSDKETFLQMQYQAQRQGYLKQFPTADWQIVLLDDVPIGRLIVDRRPQEVGLMDIALLLPYRRQGIGTRFIKQVMAEATAKQMPVRLYVSKINEGAFRLYQRLGFTTIGETGLHFWMEWLPVQLNTAS